MLPFSNDTVTIFRRIRYTDSNGKVRTDFESDIIHGCHWSVSVSKTRSDEIAVKSGAVTICLPPDTAVDAGDYAAYGEVYGEPQELNAVKITEVSRNHEHMRLGHVRVKGVWQ